MTSWEFLRQHPMLQGDFSVVGFKIYRYDPAHRGLLCPDNYRVRTMNVNEARRLTLGELTHHLGLTEGEEIAVRSPKYPKTLMADVTDCDYWVLQHALESFRIDPGFTQAFGDIGWTIFRTLRGWHVYSTQAVLSNRSTELGEVWYQYLLMFPGVFDTKWVGHHLNQPTSLRITNNTGKGEICLYAP